MMMTSNHPFKKYLIIFWSVFAAGILAIVVLFTLIGNGKLGYMPTLTELENIESSLASEVYTADSVVMRRYYFKENRTFTGFDAISPHVIKALIATEDERFYKHSGIDLRGLLREVHCPNSWQRCYSPGKISPINFSWPSEN
jgi:penicillin-binding protein 1A